MINDVELSQSLAGDNEFFKGMLDLIPPHYYIEQQNQNKQDEDPETDERPAVGKAGKGNKRPSDEILAEKTKRKIAKYDPAQIKTVSQRMTMEEGSEDEADGSQHHSGRRKKKKDAKMSGKHSASSLEDLQDRLRIKVESLRAKRNALAPGDVEIKKFKRRESKLKLKAKKKMDKQKGNIPKEVSSKKDIQSKSPVAGKPIYNKEGKMVFSKFDFTQKDEKKKEEKAGKNYKQLLEKANKDKDKMDKLKEENMDKAKLLEEKNIWKSVLQKAEGTKVRDNIDLLKKGVKRKDKVKKKHQKEWTDRDEKVEKRKKDKQEKRTKNIKKAKQSRVDKKIKKSKKKGHIIPGF